MNKKNKNTEPSPFHKGNKGEGDYKKSGFNRAFSTNVFDAIRGDFGEKYSEDEWGIKAGQAKIDDAFGRFQGIDTTQNLWEGAENLMNVGDNFGGVKTDFDNQFAGIDSNVQNRFAGVRNQYEGMENTMEDLTVNQQQAQFEKQAGQQSPANIMQQMGGAAGGSGIAGLAQAMANQGQQSAQRASASIGQQESANQMASAQQAGQIQQMKARGATEAELARATGAQGADAASMQAQMGIASGAQAAQQLGSQAELAKAGGMQAADIAMGQGAMEAQKFQLQGLADSRNLQLQQAQGELSFLAGQQGAYEANKDADTAGKSDRRLKKNITKIGESSRGFNIYSFEYKNPTDGEGLFQGVMSDEIPQEAVTRLDGYDTVNYSMLDVEFKQL